MTKPKLQSTTPVTGPTPPSDSSPVGILAVKSVEWSQNTNLEGVTFTVQTAQELELGVTVPVAITTEEPFSILANFMVDGSIVPSSPLVLQLNKEGALEFVSGEGWTTGDADTFVFNGSDTNNFSSTVLLSPNNRADSQEIIIVGTVPIGDPPHHSK
jgi:hypothetical protein